VVHAVVRTRNLLWMVFYVYCSLMVTIRCEQCPCLELYPGLQTLQHYASPIGICFLALPICRRYRLTFYTKFRKFRHSFFVLYYPYLRCCICNIMHYHALCSCFGDLWSFKPSFWSAWFGEEEIAVHMSQGCHARAKPRFVHRIMHPNLPVTERNERRWRSK
jgi:hypothetical protein